MVQEPYLKKKIYIYIYKERAGGMAQSVGPEFKPQYHAHQQKC
jgi:hypothetical protein